MDSLQYDDKAPRTPSPPAPSPHHNTNYKPDIDPVRIFSQDEDQYQWAAPQHRPSLLQELYDSDSQGLSPEQHPSPPDMYVEPQDNWPPAPPSRSGHDYTLIRRATFPYARQERPDELAQYPPFLHHPDPHGPSSAGYDPMPLSAEPSALHAHHPDGGYSPPGYPAPQDAPYEGGVKLEGHEHQHHLAHYGRHGEYAPPPQQQQQFYGRPPMHQYAQHPAQMHAAMQQQQQQHHLASMHHHAHGPHPHNGMHLGGGHNVGFPPHGLPVQHTDDAASKETQYLRRRCYNCHTTEPPSWRRSTLNPGKIVCNKCGLYERTHLRARPLRFDELRAGNKARKNGGKGVAGGSPKALGKKVGGAVQRRSSVSSTGSSVQSGGGASDWDDAGSISVLQHLRAQRALLRVQLARLLAAPALPLPLLPLLLAFQFQFLAVVVPRPERRRARQPQPLPAPPRAHGLPAPPRLPAAQRGLPRRHRRQRLPLPSSFPLSCAQRQWGQWDPPAARPRYPDAGRRAWEPAYAGRGDRGDADEAEE
ncbi:hypothetical protein B0H16DRAFT_60937 [Mycena metata]|uniref:GATA-type domain-containing protein n=1 Tax=Mycena metata TaxID=1033252 RepID=A0AAD7IC87_9AGAR|nr:hypothetical protein B0H16DRAFT_60937 [Mycena metata]